MEDNIKQEGFSIVDTFNNDFESCWDLGTIDDDYIFNDSDKLNIYQDLFISRMNTFIKELGIISGVDVRKISGIPLTVNNVYDFIKFRAILEYLIYIDGKESGLSVLFNRLFNDETTFNKQFEYDIKDICEKMCNGKIRSDLELLNRISAVIEESSNTSNDVEVATFDELQSNISDDEFGVDVE